MQKYREETMVSEMEIVMAVIKGTWRRDINNVEGIEHVYCFNLP